MSVCSCGRLPVHLRGECLETAGAPQVKPGCPDSEIVRAAVESLMSEVVHLVVVKRNWDEDEVSTAANAATDALDCLCALAAGKQWPESPKP